MGKSLGAEHWKRECSERSRPGVAEAETERWLWNDRGGEEMRMVVVVETVVLGWRG